MLFETDDLFAERLSANDAVRFHQICNQPYVLRWMDDWRMSLEQVRNLIGYFVKGYNIKDPDKHPYIMGIWHKADGELIGVCGFGPKDELGGKAEIAYFIDESYSHRGYMTQAVGRAIEFYFDSFDKPFLCALVDEDNIISKKILLKHSFVFHEKTDGDGALQSHYRLYRKK